MNPTDPRSIVERYVQGGVAAPRAKDWSVATNQDLVPGPAAHAWLTGTGSPVVQPGRSGPSVTLRCGSDVVVVDCGAGVVERLSHLGIPLRDVTVLALTHLHVDHVAELAWMMLNPLVPARSQPLRIVGPAGTRELVNRLLAAFQYDLLVREPMGFAPEDMAPEVHELGVGERFGGPRWDATVIEVDHRPVWPAFGYAFSLDGFRLVISGDTRPCPGIIDGARDCDVLVHESIWPGWGFPEYHTLPRDLGQVAAAANVGHLVLTHLIPGHLPDRVWLDEVAHAFAGRCTVGVDLMPLIPHHPIEAEGK